MLIFYAAASAMQVVAISGFSLSWEFGADSKKVLENQGGSQTKIWGGQMLKWRNHFKSGSWQSACLCDHKQTSLLMKNFIILPKYGTLNIISATRAQHFSFKLCSAVKNNCQQTILILMAWFKFSFEVRTGMRGRTIGKFFESKIAHFIPNFENLSGACPSWLRRLENLGNTATDTRFLVLKIWEHNRKNEITFESWQTIELGVG